MVKQKRGGGGMKWGGSAGKEEAPKENPFETASTNSKHNVLGRIKKKKQARKSVTLARQEAFEARKATLLVEEEQGNKSGAFVDRRFAQGDDIDEDQKALLRFQRERMAKARKSGGRFAVDDDAEEEALTHKGTALGELSSFVDNDREFSDSDEDKMDRDTVRDYHFGGGFSEADQDPERRKSKKEVMEEIIAKSKMYKAEKRMEKVERDEDLEKLNSDFADVSSILAAHQRPTKVSGGGRSKAADDGPIDEFDQLSRDLADDMRAHATARMKTPEEVAQEQRDMLVELERKRLKRMKGDADSDDEEGGRKKAKVRFSLEESGDALEDDFAEPVVRKRGFKAVKGVGEDEDEKEEDENENEEGDEDEDEDEEEEEGESGEEDEEDEDEEDKEDEEDEEDDLADLEDEPVAPLRAAKSAVRHAMALEAATPSLSLDDELPFTFEMPGKIGGLQKLLAGQTGERQDTIMERLMTCHALALSPHNSAKLQRLTTLLLERMDLVAGAAKVDMVSLDSAARALHKVCIMVPEGAAEVFHERLCEIQDALKEGLEDGTAQWPAGRDLVFLQAVGLVFPVTDFTHKIVTPWYLTLSKLLLHCPVRSPRDASAALFICSMLQEAGSTASRVVPEVATFLSALVAAFLPAASSSRLGKTHPARAMLTSWALGDTLDAGAWLSIPKGDGKGKKKGGGKARIGIESCLGGAGDAVGNPAQIAAVALEIAGEFVRSIRGHTTASVGNGARSVDLRMGGGLLVAHLSEAVGLLPQGGLPGEVDAALKRLSAELKEARQGAEAHRDALTLYKLPPVAIRQFNPRFDESFDPTRDMDPDRERAERSKIKRQTRKELKGAVRELRKDAAFIEHHRAIKVKAQRAARDERGKAIESFLQEQQFEAKLGGSKKKKKK